MKNILNELDKLRELFNKGTEGALLDANSLCRRFKITPPEWVCLGNMNLVKKYIEGPQEKKKGPGRPKASEARWIDRYRQDMINFVRADTVTECREQDFSWEQAYEAASEILASSFAFGGKDAMEHSYKEVQQQMKENPDRYYMLSMVKLPNLNKPIPADILKMKRTGRKKQG